MFGEVGRLRGLGLVVVVVVVVVVELAMTLKWLLRVRNLGGVGSFVRVCCERSISG